MASILIILCCLALNAILASLEMALVTIRRPQLRAQQSGGNAIAGRILKLKDNPERALSTIQIGITMVGAISAAVGGAGAEERIAPLLQENFGLSERAADGISILAIVLPLTYFSVVLGELVPKTIALRYPLRVLRFGFWGLEVGERVLSPVVTLFEVSTKLLMRLLPQVRPLESSPHVDLEGIPPFHQQYIVNLANIENRRIGDIMRPCDRVQFVDHASNFEDVLGCVIRSGHTRLPVMREGKVAGVLNSKEFLAFVSSGNRDWQTLIRPAVNVAPDSEILRTLRRLQGQRRHMAIVNVDDAPVGLVTLEDIFEVITGDLWDEDDDGWVRRLMSQRAGSLMPRTPPRPRPE